MYRDSIVNRKLVVCAFFLASVFSFGCRDYQNAKNKSAQEIEVKVVRLEKQDVSLTAHLNGSVRAYESADIRPQISGIIRDQLFSGGETVKKDQPLYQIDDRPFKNRYDYTEAEYQKYCAKFNLVKIKLDRYRNLQKTNSVSNQELENVKSEYAEALAQQKISLANFEDAKLNLEYTRVLSPIDGIVGKSNVTKGALVTQNQSDLLTTVVDISKVYVDLQQSADSFRRWQLRLKNGELHMPKDGFKVKVSLSEDNHFVKEGSFKFHEVVVDEDSGNLTLRAIFDNEDHILLPGMTVSAVIDYGVAKDSLSIPESAIIREPKGETFVFVVKDDIALRQRVELARAVNGYYLVKSGLNIGDMVVVSGKKLLNNGIKVKVSSGE